MPIHDDNKMLVTIQVVCDVCRKETLTIPAAQDFAALKPPERLEALSAHFRGTNSQWEIQGESPNRRCVCPLCVPLLNPDKKRVEVGELPAFVRDAVCPMCMNEDQAVQYFAIGSTVNGEHLQYTCTSCRYIWRTKTYRQTNAPG